MKIQLVLLVCFVAFVVGEPDGECPEFDPMAPFPPYLKDDTECAVYYECLSIFPFKYVCPPGSYWDSSRSQCNGIADCGNLKTTTGAPTTEPPTTAAA